MIDHAAQVWIVIEHFAAGGVDHAHAGDLTEQGAGVICHEGVKIGVEVFWQRHGAIVTQVSLRTGSGMVFSISWKSSSPTRAPSTLM